LQAQSNIFICVSSSTTISSKSFKIQLQKTSVFVNVSLIESASCGIKIFNLEAQGQSCLIYSNVSSTGTPIKSLLVRLPLQPHLGPNKFLTQLKNEPKPPLPPELFELLLLLLLLLLVPESSLLEFSSPGP